MDPNRYSAQRLPAPRCCNQTSGTRGEPNPPSPWSTYPSIPPPPTSTYQPTTGAAIPHIPWPNTRNRAPAPPTSHPGCHQTPETDPLDTGIQQSREVWRTHAYEVAHSWSTTTSPQRTERSPNTTPILVSAIYARPMFRDICPGPVYVEARGSQPHITSPPQAPPAGTTHPHTLYRVQDLFQFGGGINPHQQRSFDH